MSKLPNSTGERTDATAARRTGESPQPPSRRRRAVDAIDPIRDRLSSGARAGAEQVRINPFAALIGAAAVSAGVALLIPSSKRETEVMGEVANRLGEAAREAADNAVEAGRQHVEELAQNALATGVGALVQNVVSDSGGSSQTANQQEQRS